MHPRTQEVLAQLDGRRATLEQAVAAVPSPLRERRPGPDRWSVAEILEHLTIVEGRIARLLDERVAEARAAGLGPEHSTSPVEPTVDVATLLDRSKTIAARENSLPQGGLDASAALAALTERRRELRDTIVAADGLALGDVIIPHPRLGPLNVYQWLVFIAAHEGRHTAQIRETATAVQQS
jgi:uncharacterized damage-inducible protein DinB